MKKEVEQLLEETTKLDFPFLSKKETKEQIIRDNKRYFEDKLKSIFKTKYINSELIEEVWKQSVDYAQKQFKSLPEKQRINGFYLQELMHYYVEQLSAILEASLED
ncbi:hypothetical protein [Floccifex sp.]|uniref:hypothetical protein n=1 Tax=Floccifex sp. TaxID=2815810 RepID=UPI002A75DF8F|nr:hypothetical protein [Floccifex sp.]MDD7280389.1 hypothetical protein [Erysipelotrichaceae bacterium]MDY2958121.1 hypothetical protein [Floccifex sp.]